MTKLPRMTATIPEWVLMAQPMPASRARRTLSTWPMFHVELRRGHPRGVNRATASVIASAMAGLPVWPESSMIRSSAPGHA